MLFTRLAHSFNPVIILRCMTTYHAATTSLVSSELNGIRPTAKRHLIADVFSLSAGMRVMTCNTTPPFFPVHMKKMKVIVCVAKVGQFGGGFLGGNILVVAAKAEVIFFRFVFSIKFFRKIPYQQTSEI